MIIRADAFRLFPCLFTIIIIEVINSETFKNIDLMLFELPCLSGSRMTCICDLCYYLCDPVSEATACIPAQVN